MMEEGIIFDLCVLRPTVNVSEVEFTVGAAGKNILPESSMSEMFSHSEKLADENEGLKMQTLLNVLCCVLMAIGLCERFDSSKPALKPNFTQTVAEYVQDLKTSPKVVVTRRKKIAERKASADCPGTP